MSSAILKVSVSTPAWVSFRFSMRESSSGPISETVVRTGWPCSPKASQNTTGHGFERQVLELELLDALLDLPFGLPRLGQPGEIAFHVRHEDRHAEALKPSAMRCSVTVLPVPVAPAISPWRLAKRGQKVEIGSADFATSSGSAIGASRVIKFQSF